MYHKSIFQRRCFNISSWHYLLASYSTLPYAVIKLWTVAHFSIRSRPVCQNEVYSKHSFKIPVRKWKTRRKIPKNMVHWNFCNLLIECSSLMSMKNYMTLIQHEPKKIPSPNSGNNYGIEKNPYSVNCSFFKKSFQPIFIICEAD